MPRIFFASKSTVDKSNTVLDIVFHRWGRQKFVSFFFYKFSTNLVFENKNSFAARQFFFIIAAIDNIT